jgi:hypothetical protein
MAVFMRSVYQIRPAGQADSNPFGGKEKEKAAPEKGRLNVESVSGFLRLLKSL